MVIMANLSNLFLLIFWILTLSNIDATIMYYISPATRIGDFINYSLIFRFVRIQVQLKASEENSKKIVAAIQRSNNI